ncbi:MAG: RsbRD N-terminal domain-containing protein [Humidesulfovibrio sp.]|uniref:RsbRD N-terminal domain-containing protein n=1 Tax=Humidesulfovibrio sp. TaxID=2910988 RepID=UPI0027347482|nr:RsbRD N-terminal domain-containing protein [Humidesulfovibrio sp.]MDP2848419.1 RsbRD N-terminal domain-containing protein [Humidesulfovibrio sp.]
MGLIEEMAARSEELAQKWADLILGTYPVETQAVWRNNRDQFSNPVGHSILTATSELIPLLLSWNDAEAVAKALDKLVKIRAVQDFSPSQALSFVFVLKKLLRQEFVAQLSSKGELEELMRFETRVDNLAVIAFDLYVASRDQIARMRVEEVKRAHTNIVRRANLMKADVAAHKAD